MFGDGDGDTGTRCGVCLELGMRTPVQRHW